MKTRTVIKDLFVYGLEKMVQRKPASILMYHSVDVNPEFFTVSPDNFEWQMNYLRTNNYQVIALKDLAKKLIDGELISARTVVITFDDGYEDNFFKAFPILKKHGFPATIFLTTGQLANKNYQNKRGVKLSMLDWGQIKEMADSGLIDFEPHTVTHPKLGQLSKEEAKREILESKQIIEDRLNKKCEFFAYPYGNRGPEVEEAVRDLFKTAFSVVRGFVTKGDDLYFLKRQSVDSSVDSFRFKLKV